ncbi:MAG: hypothetical protein ACK5KU_03000 [Beutenbergiaceae bacterium]
MSTQEHIDVDHLPTTELFGELADFESEARQPEPERQWGLRALLSVGVVVVLVAVTALVWIVTGRNQQAAAQDQYLREVAAAQEEEATSAAQLQGSYDELAAQLRDAIAVGQEVVDASVGEVSDENSRVTLVEAITGATQLVPDGAVLTFRDRTVTVTPGRPLADDPDFPVQRFVIATDTIPSLTDMEAALSWLTVATEAVRADHLAWATSRLQGAIDSGRALVAEIEEGFDDSASLTELEEALVAAEAAITTEGADADFLVSHLDAVNTAMATLQDAQQDWIGEQQEAAAQAEALARAEAEQAQEDAAAAAAQEQSNNGGDAPGQSFGPNDVARILSPYTSGVGSCSEVTRFTGGAGTDWAAQAQFWAERVDYLGFAVSDQQGQVLVIVSTCPPG